MFNINRNEVFLCLVNDTGVPGATLSLTLHEKHLFFSLKSPHAIMSLITNDLDAIRNMRRGLKKAERLIKNAKDQDKAAAGRLTKTGTDRAVAEAKRQKDSVGKTSGIKKPATNVKGITRKKEIKKN